MPPTARPTATFVTLLSPPLHKPVNSLRWLTRRPLRSPQCRSLQLYKTARTGTLNGMHKILKYESYDPPRLAESNHRINIVNLPGNEADSPGQEMVAEGLSLQQVWHDHIEPGKILALAHAVPKNDAILSREKMAERKLAQRYQDYVIIDAFSTGAEARPGKKRGLHAKSNDPAEVQHLIRLRKVNMQLHVPVEHFASMMDKAFQFVQLGHPVEFKLCIRHAMDKKTTGILNERPSKDSLDYFLQHFPHFRPDFILRSMPTGSKFVVKPVSDGRCVQFVIGGKSLRDARRYGDLTRRLWDVKDATVTGIEEGRLDNVQKRNGSKGLHLKRRLEPKQDAQNSVDQGSRR